VWFRKYISSKSILKSTSVLAILTKKNAIYAQKLLQYVLLFKKPLFFSRKICSQICSYNNLTLVAPNLLGHHLIPAVGTHDVRIGSKCFSVLYFQSYHPTYIYICICTLARFYICTPRPITPQTEKLPLLLWASFAIRVVNKFTVNPFDVRYRPFLDNSHASYRFGFETIL
jgi:hypothetical protein